MHELETGLRRASQLLPPPSQGTCVLIRLASCHLASFSRALTGRKRCPGPDVTGGQPGPGLQLSGGGDRAVAGVGGGQEATRTWLFIQGTQQPQQSPFARPAEVPGKEQGPETERGWWMGAKSSGQSLQLRVLRKVHWERDIVQAGGGTALCKGQRQESRRPPRPAPAVGARGSWKEGGKSNRAGLMGAAESSGP